MKYSIKQIVVLFFSGTLIGCSTASGPAGEVPSASEVRGSDCILDGTVRDYRVLDGSNLVVTDVRKQKYHMRLNRRSAGLDSGWGIGFTTQGSRICPRSSELVVNGGFEPDVINIASIRAIDNQEYQDLLVAFGRKTPTPVETTPDHDVQGADVEELD